MKRASGNEPRWTLFDLIEAVNDCSDNEHEVIATVLHILRTGHARPFDMDQLMGRLSRDNLALTFSQPAERYADV